jgi:tetratricopeptide (TPR) repeat protein
MPIAQGATNDSVPMTLRSPETLRQRWFTETHADTALKAAAGFWFAVTFIGQILFAFSIASFYGFTAARGDWLAWNKTMTHGYASGYRVGNTVVAIHLISAVIIILSGAIQLIPQIRRRAPVFHRWNGRVYMVSAFSVSVAGLYMMWFRGTVGGFVQHLAQSFDAILIMLFAVIALRYALARDFKAHRRWALRLYLVVSASLFIRAAGIILAIAPLRGPFGFDPTTFQGPLLTGLGFGQYLVPLAILELYLHTQDRPGAARRFAMATVLFVLTVALGAGISAASVTNFVPRIKKGFDSRRSIAEALSATIASSGMDAAAERYHHLKATEPATYNFDEDELNGLGYDLIRSKRFDAAIRIFQLNVEAYPNSGNVYDSLGEAYMDDGNKPRAIAYYRESLRRNPKNRNAVAMLQKLNAP